jgi:hypothetical protein
MVGQVKFEARVKEVVEPGQLSDLQVAGNIPLE